MMKTEKKKLATKASKAKQNKSVTFPCTWWYGAANF